MSSSFLFFFFFFLLSLLSFFFLLDFLKSFLHCGLNLCAWPFLSFLVVHLLLRFLLPHLHLPWLSSSSSSSCSHRLLRQLRYRSGVLFLQLRHFLQLQLLRLVPHPPSPSSCSSSSFSCCRYSLRQLQQLLPGVRKLLRQLPQHLDLPFLLLIPLSSPSCSSFYFLFLLLSCLQLSCRLNTQARAQQAFCLCPLRPHPSSFLSVSSASRSGPRVSRQLPSRVCHLSSSAFESQLSLLRQGCYHPC